MSQRDTLRAIRLDSVFQTAVSEFAVDTTPDAVATSTDYRLSLPIASTPADTPLNLTALAASAAVDTQPPAALRPYEPIATDGVIAHWEMQNPVHLRGQAVGEAGSTVTLTFNDQSWQSTVNKWGYWNASMPAEVLKGLPDGNHTLTLTITDKAGNSTATTVDFGLYADRTLKPTLTVDTISKDDAVNIEESVYGVEISGSGTHLPPGARVTLTLGGITSSAQPPIPCCWGHCCRLPQPRPNRLHCSRWRMRVPLLPVPAVKRSTTAAAALRPRLMRWWPQR